MMECIKSFSDINKKKNLFLFLLDLVTVIFFFVTQLRVTIFNVYFSFLRFKCCSLVFSYVVIAPAGDGSNLRMRNS